MNNEKYNLQDDGFIVIENFFTQDEINSFSFENYAQEFPYQESEQKFAEIKYDFSKIVKKANNLFDAKYSIFMQKIYFKSPFEGSHEVYHQDFFYRELQGLPNENYLQCFIAIDDLDHCPLNVFRGSHKQGVLPHTLGVERNGEAKYRIRKEYLDPLSKNFLPLYLKKGSILFFDYCLAHGSSSNASPYSQTRAVVQLTKNPIPKINHGSDRRDFETNVLNKFLSKK